MLLVFSDEHKEHLAFLNTLSTDGMFSVMGNGLVMNNERQPMRLGRERFATYTAVILCISLHITVNQLLLAMVKGCRRQPVNAVGLSAAHFLVFHRSLWWLYSRDGDSNLELGRRSRSICSFDG